MNGESNNQAHTRRDALRLLAGGAVSASFLFCNQSASGTTLADNSRHTGLLNQDLFQDLVYRPQQSSGFVDRNILNWVGNKIRTQAAPGRFPNLPPLDIAPKLLVIDPGHGTLHTDFPAFPDSGALSRDGRYTEAQIVMQLSQAIAQEAAQRGYLVALTHSRDAQRMGPRQTLAQISTADDQPFPLIGERRMVLRARSDFAEQLAAAVGASSVLFASIHIDAYTQFFPQPRIFFAEGDTASADFSRTLASHFNPRPETTTIRPARYAVVKHLAQSSPYSDINPATGSMVNYTGLDVRDLGVSQSLAILLESGSWAYPEEILRLWRDPQPFAKAFVDGLVIAYPPPLIAYPPPLSEVNTPRITRHNNTNTDRLSPYQESALSVPNRAGNSAPAPQAQ